MTDTSTLNRVIAVAQRKLDYTIDPPTTIVTAASRLVEDLGADSLDMVEIAMDIEEEFGIDINHTDFADVKTIGEAARMVEKLRDR